MKFGSFLLGGLVGVAAAVYFTRNRDSMMFSSFNSKNFGKMFNKVKGKMPEKSNSFQTIQSMLDNDSELKDQIEDFLTEHRGNSYSTQ